MLVGVREEGYQVGGILGKKKEADIRGADTAVRVWWVWLQESVQEGRCDVERVSDGLSFDFFQNLGVGFSTNACLWLVGCL